MRDGAYQETEKAYQDQCATAPINQAQGRSVGLGGLSFGIRQRIEVTLSDANYHAHRAGAALRAKQIIDQHPEFAELLDLLQEF